MKIFKTVIGFIFLAASTGLLAGCALPHFPNKADAEFADMVFNADVFKRGSKAVIILDEENNIPSSIKLHGQLTFSDCEGKKYTLDVDGPSVFMLNPGRYDLENFKLHGKSGYWSSQVDYGKRYNAHFNIVAGEVIYLGKIDTQILLNPSLTEMSSDGKHKVVTTTKVKDDFASFPTGFGSLIHKYTDTAVVLRLMSWQENSGGSR